MWRLPSVVKRERNTVTAAAKNLVNSQFRWNQHVSFQQRSLSNAAVGGSSPDVAVQLDYYMSLQFAGVACALVNGKSTLDSFVHCDDMWYVHYNMDSVEEQEEMMENIWCAQWVMNFP